MGRTNPSLTVPKTLLNETYESRYDANGSAIQSELEGDFVDPLPPVSIRHRSSGRPAARNDDGFAERSPIFLLADRIHGPQLRQQLVDQRTQPRPRRTVRE